MGGHFQKGGYCPERNYLEVIVGGKLSLRESFKDNCLGGKSPGGNDLGWNFIGENCPGVSCPGRSYVGVIV